MVMMRTKKFEILSKNEIIERESSKFGTGAHIIIPKKYAGKKIKIIIEKEEEN